MMISLTVPFPLTFRPSMRRVGSPDRARLRRPGLSTHPGRPRMNVFAQLQEHGHEQVVYCREDSCGLRAIIAVHDTTLGPALGGTRMWDYASEDEALKDVLRLS